MGDGASRGRERRSTAALVIAILALVVALGGTAAAIGGFDRGETRAIKKISKQIAKRQVGARVKRVFERMPVTTGTLPIIARAGGFEFHAECDTDEIRVYAYPTNGGAWDGASDVETHFGSGGELVLVTDPPEHRVTSFAMAARAGKVVSGNLGFDFAHGGAIVPGRCLIYGHVLVN